MSKEFEEMFACMCVCGVVGWVDVADIGKFDLRAELVYVLLGKRIRP